MWDKLLCVCFHIGIDFTGISPFGSVPGICHRPRQAFALRMSQSCTCFIFSGSDRTITDSPMQCLVGAFNYISTKQRDTRSILDNNATITGDSPMSRRLNLSRTDLIIMTENGRPMIKTCWVEVEPSSTPSSDGLSVSETFLDSCSKGMPLIFPVGFRSSSRCFLKTPKKAKNLATAPRRRYVVNPAVMSSRLWRHPPLASVECLVSLLEKDSEIEGMPQRRVP